MALGWLIVGILVILTIVLIFQSRDLFFIFDLTKKYFLTFVVFGLILFFIFSFFHIKQNYDVDLSNSKGVFEFMKIYLVWMKNVALNIGSITGHIVDINWFDTGNSTVGG